MLLCSSKPPISRGFVTGNCNETDDAIIVSAGKPRGARTDRGASGQETRAEIVELLGRATKPPITSTEGLRRKGWLERAAWGEYLLVPPEHGPDALGDSNLLARASRIADLYYIGYGSAAAHYGRQHQHRSVIFVVTPNRVARARGG